MGCCYFVVLSAFYIYLSFFLYQSMSLPSLVGIFSLLLYLSICLSVFLYRSMSLPSLVGMFYLILIHSIADYVSFCFNRNNFFLFLVSNSICTIYIHIHIDLLTSFLSLPSFSLSLPFAFSFPLTIITTHHQQHDILPYRKFVLNVIFLLLQLRNSVII